MQPDQQLTQSVYQDLRERLVDRTRRNRLLHFKHNTRTTMLRVVDEVPDLALTKLQNGPLRFNPLPAPDDEPLDERSANFRSLLTAARVTDEQYRVAIAALDQDDPSAAAKEARIERGLRDRTRTKAGLPRLSQKHSLDFAAHARKSGIDPSYDLPLPNGAALTKQQDDRLQTLLFPDQLKSRVTGLARKAREVEQETGVATLHLAFGFLEWFESDDSDNAFSSPLLLLQVALERHRRQGGEDEYRLSALADPPLTNLSLELRLRDDFAITLPTFTDAEFPIESYLRKVEEATKSLKRSRVRRYMTLAPFSFARIAMYRDLDPENWTNSTEGGAAAHALVAPLIRGHAGSSHSSDSFASEYEIDDPEIEKLAPVLITDADSSQHSAIIDVMKRRNLVIEGPPGTGKSQTIANIIANVLHAGGKALFVSEKMAALDVVKSRLEKAGLGHFCLALHAAGAKPSAVIEALRERQALAPPRIAASSVAAELQAVRTRTEIKAHLEALHTEAGPLGETVHAYVGRLAELTRLFPRLPSLLRGRAGDMPMNLNQTDIEAAKERLEILETASRAASLAGINTATCPFRLLDRTDFFPEEREALFSGLEQLVEASQRLQTHGERIRSALHRPKTSNRIGHIVQMVAEVQSIADPPDGINRLLLSALTSRQAIADANWYTQQADALEKATSKLHEAGIDDPSYIRIELIGPIIKAAPNFGVADLTVEQLIASGSKAKEEQHAWEAPSKTIAALTSLLGLPDDLEIGVIRLACAAAKFAASVDPMWHGYCRPGLEQHLSVLNAGALQQEALLARKREISTRFDLENLSYHILRNTANILQNHGLLSAMRSDAREARRLFKQRWRGGPLPPANTWSTELYAAAEMFAMQNTLAHNAALRQALGELSDPNEIPLAQVARAAQWQSDVVKTLSTARPEAASLCATLLTIKEAPLAKLAGFAGPANRLLTFLDEQNPSDHTVWFALRHRAVSRSANLNTLANGLKASGLPGTLPICELGHVAAFHAQWAAATGALASERAQAFAKIGSIETVRATIAFVQELWAHLQDACQTLIADGWTDNITALRNNAEKAQSAAQAISETLNNLATLGLTSFAPIAHQQTAEAMRQGAAEMLAAASMLSPYLNFATARAACQEHSIASAILTAFNDGAEKLHHLPEALEWLVAWTIVRRHAEAKRNIFSRTGEQLSTYRHIFASADRARLATDAQKVQGAIISRPIPGGIADGSKKDWTDNALLENEFTKKTRHIPIRDLLNRAGNAVLSLTPCLMMSPLTVAQYLAPGGLTFDVVIMDEASQIKPEDAIGALLRGRQTVIVGDPKQLPPTNFFDRAIDEPDDDIESDADDNAPRLSAEDRVAAESVLDLATRAFRPARRLRWHYRSQHESLIAFSNREFYSGNLVVFPSSHAPSESLGIEFVRVPGLWRERINEEEAKAVAIAAAAFMRRHPTLSLGIIAMNQPQRELIQAEIDQAVAGDNTLVQYIEQWDQRLEPYFVKNLENVQGDERDTIFISLGWGRTPAGAVHQRFYPVSRREDGHRRLNVLFTRAKRKIVVFSSIEPEDVKVDPQKTSPGVRILRDYLAYARDGRIEQGNVDESEADSPFETSVANALLALGHDVALQVGVAGYRIDIAARHPAKPAKFVLGIECDGASYHSAKSARDRDRLRQEALERLGWRLVRVWSTDWFRDPVAEAKRLSENIKSAIAETELDEQQRSRLIDQQDIDLSFSRDSFATAPESAETPTMQEESSTSAQPQALADALRNFRENVIMHDFPGSEPGRCILRDDMIKAIIKSGLDDPSDFHQKIPDDLRTRTDGRQVPYLERIADIVAEHMEKAFS